MSALTFTIQQRHENKGVYSRTPCPDLKIGVCRVRMDDEYACSSYFKTRTLHTQRALSKNVQKMNPLWFHTQNEPPPLEKVTEILPIWQ